MLEIGLHKLYLPARIERYACNKFVVFLLLLYSCVGFDLESVLYELKRLKFPVHKWRLLANSLRVASVVDNIDADHRDVAGKLQAVISHWVKSTTQHNQWITLVEAIDTCFECGVAEQLATAVGVEYNPLPPPLPPTPPISLGDDVMNYVYVVILMVVS